MIQYQVTVHFDNGDTMNYLYSEFSRALDKLNNSSRPTEVWFLVDGVRSHFVGSNYDENGLAEFI